MSHPWKKKKKKQVWKKACCQSAVDSRLISASGGWSAAKESARRSTHSGPVKNLLLHSQPPTTTHLSNKSTWLLLHLEGQAISRLVCFLKDCSLILSLSLSFWSPFFSIYFMLKHAFFKDQLDCVHGWFFSFFTSLFFLTFVLCLIIFKTRCNLIDSKKKLFATINNLILNLIKNIWHVKSYLELFWHTIT